MPKPKSRKRKGPKSTQAGCLMCKPHKHQAEKDTQTAKTPAQRQRDDDAREQVDDA